MDEKIYANRKCFAIKKRGSLKEGLLSTVLFTAFVGLMVNISAFAQDPCSERGPDCRVLTPTEVKAFKELVLAVSALLPVPDPARYVPNGAIEASTMPFVAETKISGVTHTGGSWRSGCFPISPNNSLLFGYDAKTTSGKSTEKDKNPLVTVQTALAIMENKIELGIELLPHPYLVNVEDVKTIDIPD